jgi:selenocysteine-specific elongation factor
MTATVRSGAPARDGADKIKRVVVGTAGHIDHGKSSLVKRLTGIDPDRLPEEKARGLTIDLGFANYELSDGSRLGLVDVPGHEKFVHNMVAGATGIDLALLVIAADDGVMPQTTEHLEILELLGLRRGAIALTKIDLVGPELRELAAADARAAVKGTFLESAPIFPVSSTTGEGIDALKAGLESLVSGAATREAGGVFRMPIQRVFAAKGFGCVVTGIPISGSLSIGDKIEIAPAGLPGVVRGLEAYHRTVATISAGHSSAINVSGVEAASCVRGMVAVTPGYFSPVNVFEARIRHLARRRRALKHREALRLHVGTMETAALLLLLDSNELAPGADALVQIATEDPVVLGAGDRFLLRLPSPAETVGGGVVVGASNRRARRRDPSSAGDLAASERSLGDLAERALLAIGRAKLDPMKTAALARILGVPEREAEGIVDRWVSSARVVRLRTGGLVHRDPFDAACKLADDTIQTFLREHPERLVCDRGAIREGTHLDGAVLDEVLAELARARRIEIEAGGGARNPTIAAALTPAQQDLRARALARLEAAHLKPPTNDELASELGAPRAALDAVLKRLVDEKAIARVSPEYHFSQGAVELAKQAIVKNCSARKDGDVDLPSLRDALDTTRRWLIPLMEWFDGIGFTSRLGARRILKRRP